MMSNDPTKPRVWNTPEKEGMLRFLDINNLKIARARKARRKVYNNAVALTETAGQYASDISDSAKRKVIPVVVAGGLTVGAIKGCSNVYDLFPSSSASVQQNPQKAIASAMLQADENLSFDEIVNHYAGRVESRVENKIEQGLEQLGLRHKRELTLDTYVANNYQTLLGDQGRLVGVFRDFNKINKYYAPVINKVIDKLDASYGNNHGITYNLLTALIAVESGGKKNVCSKKSACGLMQITPITAKEMGMEIGFEGDPLTDDRMKPSLAIKAGAEYLIKLKNRFNDSTELALMAYNWGPTNLSNLIKEKGTDNPNQLMKYLNLETKNYVVKILSRIDILNQIENNKHGDYRLKKAEDAAVKYKKAA